MIKIVITTAIGIILVIINEVTFRKLLEKQKRLHYSFFRRFSRIVIVFLTIIIDVSYVVGSETVWKNLVGSTVVLGAVVGFAAQNILKDAVAGLAMSIDRPFDIGDRVIMDGIERPCIVEFMTLRNTILKTMDGLRYIVPNSEMDQKIIMNCSFRQQLRGSIIQITISGESDIAFAIHIIREVIKESPLTRPNNPNNHDLDGYSDVYLMTIIEDALLLETVIWTEPETDNTYACSEIRMAIVQEFRKNNIEIPYKYINIIQKEEPTADFDQTQESYSSHRRDTKIRTNKAMLNAGSGDMDRIISCINQYTRYTQLDKENFNTLRLLSEELIIFSRTLTDWKEARYWLEGTQNKALLRLEMRTWVDSESKKVLDEISTDGVHESAGSFKDMIKRMIVNANGSAKRESLSYRDCKNRSDLGADLEKTLLISLSDDVKVSIKGQRLTITIVKTLSA